MFRRKRSSGFRPPASSAWWPAAADGAVADLGSAAPALPSEDPFGGWPVFPAPETDPTDPVLGQPAPVPGWAPAGRSAYPGAPVQPGLRPAEPVPPSNHARPARPEPPTGCTPRPLTAPVQDATPVARPATSAPGGPPAPSPGLDPTWTPLLTHADDSQPFRAITEDTEQPAGEERPSPMPSASPPDRPASRRSRSGRRRGGRGRRELAPVPDSVDQADPTTWLNPATPPNPLEAAALAGAFAADYLSWDETAPQRRGQVLAQYLPSDVVGSPALLGWSGKGRQRAEFALPGAVHPDGDGRVVVDVRVRVTPYRSVGQPVEPEPAGELEVAGVPAVAPAPTARGWKSLGSYWVRMTVPITYDRGRLVVDTWDEQLGQDPGATGGATDGAAAGKAGDDARPVSGAPTPVTESRPGTSDRGHDR